MVHVLAQIYQRDYTAVTEQVQGLSILHLELQRQNTSTVGVLQVEHASRSRPRFQSALQ